MSDLNIQLCPETGICSLIKPDGKKVDLMPGEVSALREASGDPDAIKKAISEVDPSFADALDAGEVDDLAKSIK